MFGKSATVMVSILMLLIGGVGLLAAWANFMLENEDVPGFMAGIHLGMVLLGLYGLIKS